MPVDILICAEIVLTRIPVRINGLLFSAVMYQTRLAINSLSSASDLSLSDSYGRYF